MKRILWTVAMLIVALGFGVATASAGTASFALCPDDDCLTRASCHISCNECVWEGAEIGGVCNFE